MSQCPRKRDIRTIKKSLKINNSNFFKNKGGIETMKYEQKAIKKTSVYKKLEMSEMNK